jgi:hypothetical protein
VTVLELLEALSDYPEEAEVRLAQQPAWPFEWGLGAEPVLVAGVVYIPEGEQLGYLPGAVAKELGWR